MDMFNRIVATHQRDSLFHSGFACSGVSIGDVTGDGLPDVFLANGPEANRLCVNLANDAWLTGRSPPESGAGTPGAPVPAW